MSNEAYLKERAAIEAQLVALSRAPGNSPDSHFALGEAIAAIRKVPVLEALVRDLKNHIAVLESGFDPQAVRELLELLDACDVDDIVAAVRRIRESEKK